MVRSLVAPLAVVALIVTAGCGAPPADQDVSLKHVTADGRFVVTLQPPAAPPTINQMQAWGVRVSTPAGLPVSSAPTAAVRMPADAAGSPRDGWTAEEPGVLASMRLSQLPLAPADPSNAVESDPAAVVFGKRLFNHARFSRNQAASCSSCHAPDQQFQDSLPLGRGVVTGTRRSMPIVGAAHSPWLFWDGRKDSLWAQALGPLSSPIEKAAWEAMAAETRDAISRVFAGMGKAIAAYERTLAYGESRFDRCAQAAIDGDVRSAQVLSTQEVRGLRLFIGKGRRVTCHNGPLATDQHFHNTGVPPRDPTQTGLGRAAAIDQVRHDEFNCLGRFSDAKAGQCEELRFMVTAQAGLKAAFKTPSLRNVALRPPYMHAGQFTSLEEVIGHYVKAPAAFLSSLSGPITETTRR